MILEKTNCSFKATRVCNPLVRAYALQKVYRTLAKHNHGICGYDPLTRTHTKECPKFGEALAVCVRDRLEDLPEHVDRALLNIPGLTELAEELAKVKCEYKEVLPEMNLPYLQVHTTPAALYPSGHYFVTVDVEIT